MHTAHRHPRSGRGALAIARAALRAVVVMFLAAIVVGAAPARAENRVAELSRMMASTSPRTRLSAVLALAKLGDPAAEKPLVKALRDPSVRVRVVAAAALGGLESDQALPALQQLAQDDSDPEVRKAASNAAIKIASGNRRREERVASSSDVGAIGDAARRAPAPVRPTAARAGEPHPDLYLTINGAADESPGNVDVATRKQHAEILRRALLAEVRTEPAITSAADDARRWGLAGRHIDLSVTRLAATKTGAIISIEAQLRLTISDDAGKMLSFLSGGAKVEVPSQKFDTRYLPALRKQALENALHGMFGKLLAHLRTQT